MDGWVRPEAVGPLSVDLGLKQTGIDQSSQRPMQKSSAKWELTFLPRRRTLATMPFDPIDMTAGGAPQGRFGATPPDTPHGRGRAIARSIDCTELRALYEGGDSTVDLQNRHGVSRGTIRKLLREAGCELRDVRQASRVRPAACWLRLEKPVRLRERREVEDAFGEQWEVTHETPTHHGFAILRGVASGSVSHTPSIILTVELATHFERHRQAPRHLDLPMSLTVITRLRRRLGQDWLPEKEAWWQARRNDLERLTSAAFAARHHVPAGTAIVARRRYFGLDGHRHDWSNLDARAYVLSGLPLDEIAATLAISIGHARNLRGRFRKGAVPTNG